MSALVPIAMFAWPIAAIAIFAIVPARRAILATYLAGWLFLPQAGYSIAGLPDYTRMTAVNAAVLVGAALFAGGEFTKLRLRPIDMPMIVWCLSPLPTSVTNDLGVYDGLSDVLERVLTWGAPYFIGRQFFGTASSSGMLAIAVVLGAIVYVPLCLFEMRMSPQLHQWVYGYMPSRMHTTHRLGGYRPMVFMGHGIAVGLWMAVGALTAMWLWLSGAVRSLFRVPMAWIAPGLFGVALLCRSLNAIILLVAGLLVLWLWRAARWRWPAVVLSLVPAAYVCVRAPMLWDARVLVPLAREIDLERAVSLESRLSQEEVLTAKAWERAAFGWGGYKRNRVQQDDSDRDVVTDSLWIVVFGQYGLTGLLSLGAALTAPLVVLWLRDWGAGPSALAPAAALSIGTGMYMCDCLMNGMLNPIYHVMLGTVAGVAVGSRSPLPEKGEASPAHAWTAPGVRRPGDAGR